MKDETGVKFFIIPYNTMETFSTGTLTENYQFRFILPSSKHFHPVFYSLKFSMNNPVLEIFGSLFGALLKNLNL